MNQVVFIMILEDVLLNCVLSSTHFPRSWTVSQCVYLRWFNCVFACLHDFYGCTSSSLTSTPGICVNFYVSDTFAQTTKSITNTRHLFMNSRKADETFLFRLSVSRESFFTKYSRLNAAWRCLTKFFGSFFFIFSIYFLNIYMYCSKAEFNKLIKTVGHCARFFEKNMLNTSTLANNFDFIWIFSYSH